MVAGSVVGSSRRPLIALGATQSIRFSVQELVQGLFDSIDDADWSEREARRLEESFRAGAKGLKFYKAFGLHYRHKDGQLVRVDDPKLDGVWEMCAKHKRPVVIHVADPAAFFT